MDPLETNELIQKLINLLEENDRQGQGQDLSQLMWYMDGMNRQFDAMFQELQEVKTQLAQEKQPAIKYAMQGILVNLENKLQWARNMLDGLRERIADSAQKGLENFKENGAAALDKAVAALGVKDLLEVVQEHISGMIDSTKKDIEKLESIGHELRSAGAHLKNAGRAAADKETQTVDGGQEGHFQSTILAPMRAVNKMLSRMNNATLAAIGNLENLEQTAEAVREARQAEKKPEKKPSVRKKLEENKAEISAKSAPAPDKARKPKEAEL